MAKLVDDKNVCSHIPDRSIIRHTYRGEKELAYWLEHSVYGHVIQPLTDKELTTLPEKFPVIDGVWKGENFHPRKKITIKKGESK